MNIFDKVNLDQEQEDMDNGMKDQPEVLIMRNRDLDIPSELPIMGLDGFVLFPFMLMPLIVVNARAKKLVDDSLRGDRLVGFFLKRDASKPETFDNLHEVGTVGMIIKMLRMPDGTVRLFIHGIDRIRIAEQLSEDPYLKARVEKAPDVDVDSRAVQAMMKNAQGQFAKIAQMGNLPEDIGLAAMGINDPGKLSDLIASNLSLKIDERQEVLDTSNVEKRLQKVIELLGREMDLLELGSEIQSKVRTEMDKTQREYVLREQMKAIKKELGEDERNPDIKSLAEAIRKANMPKHALETANKELERLEMMHPSSAEYSVSRTYIDWLTSLPWKKQTRDNINIEKAKNILDEDHFDLADVKERILEYLSVLKLKKKIRGPILCFVGPPGVGKTSLGQSIARALGRKFHRMSLGGMRDEAEIRGHRRTYIGAMPGRLIKALKDSGSNNPLIMLDEVDKLGTDFRGDPSSALLEVLDPAQNFSFTDNYLDMPFDLSNVMFITTANVLDPVPPALLDRMEVLKLSGYTTFQKLEIAKRYLMPRGYDNTGISAEQAVFTDDAFVKIIEDYTREAGVRNLEREIENILRKIAVRVAAKETVAITIEGKDIETYLGPTRVFHEMADRMGTPGLAIGLAVTQHGGEILFVECSAVPGSGQLLLTGQLGDIMKESAMAAFNYLHSNCKDLGIPEENFSRQNVHLHVPAGATPKDGPSAGITMAVALASLFSQRPVKDYLAMTGEITLKGNVLPVGGIKEKVLAAHRSGIKELILPSRCEAELRKDVPPEVLQAIKFHFVNHVSQVLDVALPPQDEGEKKDEPRGEENANKTNGMAPLSEVGAKVEGRN